MIMAQRYGKAGIGNGKMLSREEICRIRSVIRRIVVPTMIWTGFDVAVRFRPKLNPKAVVTGK